MEVIIISVSRVSTMALGLLVEGEKHGYELVREMEERGLLRWTRASKVAVYKALARLEKDGCLTSWTEKLGRTPEKRVYAITSEGEERLRDLVYSLCSSQEPLRFETSVAVTFIHRLSREEAGDALERRLRYMESQANRLRSERGLLEGLGEELYLEILDHELEVYKGEARWLSRIIGKIDVGGGEEGLEPGDE